MIAMLISAIFLIRGLVNLFTGRCKIGENRLESREARIAGLVFFLQFFVGLALYGIVWNIFDLGGGASSVEEGMAKDVVDNLFMTVIFLAAVLGSYFWTKAYAKKAGGAPAHSILDRKE
jgi:hypothetical protein